MRKRVFCFTVLIAILLLTLSANAEQIITSKRVSTAPVIDGTGNDPVWADAPTIVTHDKIANIDMTLKTVYTDDMIFFLAEYPDKNESRTHKSWVWDKGQEFYDMGNDREDAFILVWNMSDKSVNLSIYGGEEHRVDMWFWKACRTDPVGFADDKIDTLQKMEVRDATKLVNASGEVMYLVREGDSGTPAFITDLVVDYRGDTATRFKNVTPTGSRADVKAKGTWKDGKWAIEFARKLDTGNIDDVRFDVGKSYQFGVSRYEIAGRGEENTLSEPHYGDGDVSESLTLEFAK